MKDLRVEMYAQDGCSVCETMKEMYGLTDKAQIELVGVPMNVIYNNVKVAEMGYKHVPVTLILEDDEVLYREFGVVDKDRLQGYLEVLRDGGTLVTEIKNETK